MNEIILTDEDMNPIYDAIDNMSQELLDSLTEYIFGVELCIDKMKILSYKPSL